VSLAFGSVSLILEGLGVMLASIGIGGAFGIAAAVLEGKPNEEIARWGYWGTTAGVVLGIPLTISAFVLIARG
jgi:hypothetical protein